MREGFGALKVFNEEVLNPGRSFTLQTHKDMVVVTYVNEGVMIFNRPRLGKTGLMESGDFHHAHSATGAKQYSLNASRSEEARLFQSGFAPGSGRAGTWEGIKSTSPSPSARAS